MPKVHLHETVDEMRKFNSRRKLKVTIYTSLLHLTSPSCVLIEDCSIRHTAGREACCCVQHDQVPVGRGHSLVYGPACSAALTRC